MKENHEVRDRPAPLPEDSSWPRKLAEQTVTGVGNVRAVEGIVRLVIERCAQEVENFRGEFGQLQTKDIASRIRALASEDSK